MKTETAIKALVREGAALVMSNDRDQHAFGVGFARLVTPRRLYWWTTGISDFDHHLLNFETVEVIYGGQAVEFLDKAGALVAYLAPVHEQEYNPDQVKVTLEAIQDWKREFEANDYFRGNVIRLYRESLADDNPPCIL